MTKYQRTTVAYQHTLYYTLVSSFRELSKALHKGLIDTGKIQNLIKEQDDSKQKKNHT